MAIKAYTYFVMMIKLKLHLLFCFLLPGFFAVAQIDTTPVFKGAVKDNREKTYYNIIKNSIIKNLSLPLTDSTEENWEDAFYAMEVLQYKQPWVMQKVKTAFDSANKRSAGFQRALVELTYTNYPNTFSSEINELLLFTKNAKTFAMCSEYLLKYGNSGNDYIEDICSKSFAFEENKIDSLLVSEVLYPMKDFTVKAGAKPVKPQKIKLDFIVNKKMIQNNTIIYSIQRKNRNYPGIAIIRDSTGKFITDASGEIFFVQQLARSITNMPGYLTNGNTPQGIFRMYGFAVSKSAAIGPTENIQLTMPFETSVQHFLKDSTIVDSVWTPELYARLLPDALKKHHPLFGTYYASAIGRTEIIAHGTTVDPAYYKGQTYYPYTPTQGCLCTKEIWSDINGKRIISDQQKLVDAVKKAGGADGYLIVFEIDDQQKPVSIDEILPYLKINNEKRH
jgi:hypothetical protein